MNISPETVLSFKKPTADFICADTGYKYFFVEFKIKNLDNNQILFEVKRPDGAIRWEDHDTKETEGRAIEYTFPKSFLDSKQIQTKLSFAVGPKEIKNLRMIERHYFDDKLLRSYDFQFGFCIPNTINTWESLYELPELNDSTKREMMQRPKSTVSDSFYFIDNKLVLHNKAFYSYQ
ncbi:Unc119b [Globomyces pollinis-pini]|nr:Unc119b [Globomyces pollinis-pini]